MGFKISGQLKGGTGLLRPHPGLEKPALYTALRSTLSWIRGFHAMHCRYYNVILPRLEASGDLSLAVVLIACARDILRRIRNQSFTLF